jgi:ATP-dependent RNA helicase DDX52/ROK1
MFQLGIQQLIFLNCQKAKPLARQALAADASPTEMPAELDFFKYARNSTGKRKQQDPLTVRPQDKKRRVDDEDDLDDPDDSQEHQDAERPPERHRVTSKGNNIPDAINSFEALHEEYRIPSHIYQNLLKSGFKYPTSIQCHAAPILLRVRVPVSSQLSLTDQDG